MITRDRLPEFAGTQFAPPLPCAPAVKHLLLYKHHRIPAACNEFANCFPERIRRSVPERQYEYLLGRLAASVLLQEMGLALPDGWLGSIGPRPAWPSCVIGSIAHSEEIVAVSVAPRTCAQCGVGTDLEAVTRCPDTLGAMMSCFSAAEEQLLARVEHGAVLGFAAKESLFKCLNPICHEFFDFKDAEVLRVEPAMASFTLRLLTTLHPQLPAGTCLDGCYTHLPGHVWAGVHWSA